ncbi:MAG: pilus assembly protein CpaE [Candidatus Paceibacteria bacterium]|jgi:pilus assembly protein CpaE
MKNPQILIVGRDESLRGEFAAALKGIKKWKPVLQQSHDIRKGLEAARARRPELICFEVEGSSGSLVEFAEEIGRCAPESVVVATYRSENFDGAEVENKAIINGMRNGVADFLRRPLSTGELQQLLDRVFSAAPRASRSLGKVISFVSNKGGAGKSTTSVSTAVSLAMDNPNDVLLIDTSLQLGVAAMMVDVNPITTIVDAIQESHRLDETLIRQLAVPSESGLHVLAAPLDAIEASHVDEEGLSRIITLARRAYKYVIVDTYPMLDSVIMAALDLSDLVYVVFHATVPSVVGNAHFLEVLKKVGVSESRQRIILNYNFPKVAGNLKVADVVERLGREVEHVFPFQKKLITALNTGKPYALTCGRRFGFGKALYGVTSEIENLPSPSAEPRAAADRGTYPLAGEAMA